MTRKYVVLVLLALSGFLTLADTARAQNNPKITNVSQRGIQSGAPTVLVVEGGGLLPEPTILLPVKIVKQSVRGTPTNNRVEIELTVDGEAPAGVYPLRLVTRQGVSNAVNVGIDALENVAFTDAIKQLPIAMTGSIAGNQRLETTFMGHKGDQCVVEIEAQRLGSKLNPMIHLHNDRHVQLVWAQRAAALGGDARLVTTLPADGKYIIELHDALYNAGGPGFFRLKIGALKFADMVFPMAVRRGEKVTLGYLGTNLPAGLRMEFIAPTSGEHDSWAPLPPVKNITGFQPRVLISDSPQLVETHEKTPQVISAPGGVSGVISAANETDNYQVAVTPGMPLIFEVTAARMNSPLDADLTVYDEHGTQLSSNDDEPGTTDSVVKLTVPGNVKMLRLALRDTSGRGGREFAYHLAVVRPDQPQFTLKATPDRAQIARGGAALLDVNVDRMGYNGPIQLKFLDLPPGLKAAGTLIPANAVRTLVTLQGEPTAQRNMTMVRLSGHATQGKASDQLVKFGMPRGGEQSAATRFAAVTEYEAPIVISDAASLVTIAWKDKSETLPAFRGVPVSLGVNLSQAEGTKGSIRLSLVSTQPQVRKTVVEGLPRQVADPERMVRLGKVPALKAGEKEANLPLEIPADYFNQPPNAVTLKAELLSANGKNSLATSYTPARLLKVDSALRLDVAGPPRVVAPAGEGPIDLIVGKVTRRGGFTGRVQAVIEDLPPGLSIGGVEVGAKRVSFELPVSFPFGTETKTIKAKVVLQTPGAAGPGTRVRSNGVPIEIQIVPGQKPAPDQPYAVFEDQAEFISALQEGGGKATLVKDDKYTGTASVRVTPDQKFSTKLPGLNVKIAGNPGPGEYRYIRFAWKKRGGAQLILQFNHEGAWGPTTPGGPKFRYHIGSKVGEPLGGSIAVGETLPNDWMVVTRDLYQDFGAFKLMGIALSPLDGEYAMFDHIYLARTKEGLDLAPKPEMAKKK